MIKSEVGAHTSEKSVDAVLCSSLSQLRLKEEHDGLKDGEMLNSNVGCDFMTT